MYCVFKAIKYDPVKEERYLQEAKQKELQRIEETLQLVARRGEETPCLFVCAVMFVVMLSVQFIQYTAI